MLVLGGYQLKTMSAAVKSARRATDWRREDVTVGAGELGSWLRCVFVSAGAWS